MDAIRCRNTVAAWAVVLMGAAAGTARAGEFERWQLGHLTQAFREPKWAMPVDRVTWNYCKEIPTVFPDARGTFVIFCTAEGNYAKMLFEFRVLPMVSGSETYLCINKLVLYNPRGVKLRVVDDHAVSKNTGFNCEKGTGLGNTTDFWFSKTGKSGEDMSLSCDRTAKMLMVWRNPLLAVGEGPAPAGAQAGEFGYWNLARVKQAFNKNAWGRQTSQLRVDETVKLGNVLKTNTGMFVLARTASGTMAKVLCLFRPWEHVKPQGKQVLWLARVTAFKPDGTPMYERTNVPLLANQSFDLDAGRISGTGIDLTHKAWTGGTIKNSCFEASRGTLAFVVQKSLYAPPSGGGVGAQPAAGPPAAGKVTPASFAGEYRVRIDGRWDGTLHLRMLTTGQVQASSFYTSAAHGNKNYKVTGGVDTAVPHKIVLQLHLPTGPITLQGFLGTGDKKQIVGLSYMDRNYYGFIAQRTR